MKSPFVILLAIVVLIGIAIGAAVIIFLGPNNQDADETIPIAAENELPTPSSRNVPPQTQSQAIAVSTPAPVENSVSEQALDLEEQAESDEAQVTEAAEQGATDRPRGTGAFTGSGPGGGAGAPNFQAIQEAMESNPEIQELIQKAQSGNISQEDQARLRELMQEALADAGIEPPGGGQSGFGAPPIQGTIAEISGSTLTIEHADDSGLSTHIAVADTTSITIINELKPADLATGDSVAGTVQRGEGGRIFILNLTVLPQQQGQAPRGGARGLFGGATFAEANDPTNVSNINGTIAEINDQTISVETTQGTLRLTANEESNIISTSQASLSDITEDMAAIAFGGNQENTPIQPANLIVGPESLLQQGNNPAIRGRGTRQADQDQ